MRPYTSCKKTVHELLYGELNYKIKSIEYGRVMETMAKQKFEDFLISLLNLQACVWMKMFLIAASPGTQIDIFKITLIYYCRF